MPNTAFKSFFSYHPKEQQQEEQVADRRPSNTPEIVSAVVFPSPPLPLSLIPSKCLSFNPAAAECA